MVGYVRQNGESGVTFAGPNVSGLPRGSFGMTIHGVAFGDGIDGQHERVQQREPEQKQQHDQIRIDVGGHRKHPAACA